MARRLTTKFLATALALSPLMLATTIAQPAAAQIDFSVNIGAANTSVSFGYFYNALAPYGRWYHHPRWGDVWHPIDVPPDFRPYYRGHWDYTGQYGWLWESDFPWGDIAFHYGRWIYDPYDGWLWIPGYVWAPAWVVWRESGGNIGWFPMPPDDPFLAGDEIYRTDWNDWDRGFGYSDWYGPQYGPNFAIGFWTFVDRRHFADRDYLRYAADPREYRSFINNSRNITNYTTVNNIIVNRSVDVRQIERESGRRIAEVNPRDVIRNAPITPLQTGRQVQLEERRLHGGNPRASARDRFAVLPPQNVPGQFTPTSPPFGGLRNQPPQGQNNQGPPPNEQFRGRGQFGQRNPELPQGQANQGPPPNEQSRRRGQFGQRNPELPQGQVNQGPPPNEQFRGRGQFGQRNPELPQGQASQGPPPNEQFRGRGQFGETNPRPPRESFNPFQPPPQVAPPSQANIQRGRPPEVVQPAPAPQVRGGPPPQAQGGPPPREDGGRGRGRNHDKN